MTSYEIGCYICGGQEHVCAHPHRKPVDKGCITGFIYLCKTCAEKVFNDGFEVALMRIGMGDGNETPSDLHS